MILGLKSGVYQIQPKNKSIWVLCDMEIRDGGWTVIQKRYEGYVNFFTGYKDYKFGFGALNREFWMGLENIYQLTANENSALLIEILVSNHKTLYAHYNRFALSNEFEGYTIKVIEDYSGDAGDALKFNKGVRFSTMDTDQDKSKTNCAYLYNGGWWYMDCMQNCLNGNLMGTPVILNTPQRGIHWYEDQKWTSLQGSRMLLRLN